MTVQSLTTTQAVALPVGFAVEAKARVRMLYLDNLRILLAALVILHHLSIGYGASGDWYYNEVGEVSMLSAVLMTMFTAINQSFFMGMFFMISSYLTPSSYDRKGAAVYLVDRLKRLGLPILFYAFIIQPLLVYVLAIKQYGFQGSLADFISQQGFGSFGVGPLWFVEELLIFSLVYVLWRRFTRSSNAPSTVVAHLDAPSNKAIALFALMLGLVTFTFRILFPVGWWLEPLHLQLAHLPQYIALFAVGIIAYRNNWFEALDDSQGSVWRWVVVALIPVFLVVGIAGGALDGDVSQFAGGLHWQALAMAVWEQFMCAALIVTLLLAFRKRLNRQSGLVRALSDATYSTYVVHAPVITLLALSLSAIQLEGGVKFVLVAPAALALAFAVGYLFRKLPVASKVL